MYNKSKIMKRAHEIKKQDSKNIWSLCLKMAWAEAKSQKMADVLIPLGFKVWTGGNHKRIYIDGLDDFKRTGLMEKYVHDYTQFRIATVYFDMWKSEFVCDRKAQRATGMKELLNDLMCQAYDR